MLAHKRLQKELVAFQKDPPKFIMARPQEDDILRWHYVIEGAPGTPYEGGLYHGMVRFSHEYPLKPPSILMYTPNGRFATNTRLCMSMSDFHPETWVPTWSVSTLLLGIQSFMAENAPPSAGSIETTDADKRAYARDSLRWNVEAGGKEFRKLFPELVERYEKARGAGGGGSSSAAAATAPGAGTPAGAAPAAPAPAAPAAAAAAATGAQPLRAGGGGAGVAPAAAPPAGAAGGAGAGPAGGGGGGNSGALILLGLLVAFALLLLQKRREAQEAAAGSAGPAGSASNGVGEL